ncbi:conserved phage C-terminal domain-containing protein [Ralstonia pickettii]|uniref:conserved phage C-terminal domain-containing protein n=1 Tax=Ralstonia pickettii TaxID=329 RepID=UPI0021166247|nr:conserved phage C-terminal domain-containing protein [Ralstonia pickettii]
MTATSDTTTTPRARYRKIEVRMWGDEKFRALSPMQPSGQALWVFLLTGPHTGPIPGVFRAGRAALAEELDWALEAFDKAFSEVSEQGMARADWKAKVVWIPNAITCNKPESPNVIRSWASEWALIPECDLKREAFASLKSSIEAISEAYGKAFAEAFGKPSAKACRNQEQEQEQEQEQKNILSGKPDDAREVISYLNAKAKSAFRCATTNVNLIRARLKSGATVEQCKAVVDAKVAEWGANPEMRKFLRPETLFGATKFEQYLGQLGSGGSQNRINGHGARFEN